MSYHRGTKTATLFIPQERFHVNAWTVEKQRTGSGSQKWSTQIRFLINWFENKLLRSLEWYDMKIKMMFRDNGKQYKFASYLRSSMNTRTVRVSRIPQCLILEDNIPFKNTTPLTLHFTLLNITEQNYSASMRDFTRSVKFRDEILFCMKLLIIHCWCQCLSRSMLHNSNKMIPKKNINFKKFK